jgi:hypothetical protein
MLPPRLAKGGMKGGYPGVKNLATDSPLAWAWGESNAVE